MQPPTLLLTSSLLLTLTSAFPVFNPGSIPSTLSHFSPSHISPSRISRPCRGTRCPDPADPRTQDTSSFHLSSSSSSSSDIPDAYIYHSPEDGDAKSECPNPLPVDVLFTVQQGHGCLKMAKAYDSANSEKGFNCQDASRQREKLCGEVKNFGKLAESCYGFLVKQGRGEAAADVEPYRRLCARGGA